jgi:tetratricopeptide (TPR) repeat protein
MAPEQREGQRDVRSDQYSLCAALFEALTGRLPNEAREDDDAPGARTRARSRPPRRVLRALERGLAPRPDDRFPTLDALLAALTADPWRTWRAPLSAAACGVLVLGGIGIYRTALHRHRAQLCVASTVALDGTWGPSRALGIAHATRQWIPAERWQRIQARLDDYARQVARSAAHNCQTSRLELHHWRVVAEPLFDLRAECLASTELRLDALATALEHADQTTADHALLAAGSLPPPSACDDPRAFVGPAQTPSSGAAHRRAALDRALAQAEVAVATGHGATLDTSGLLTEARAIKDRPLEAEALLIPTGSPEQQEANFYQAAWAAEGSHADPLAVRAWTRLAQLLIAKGRTEDASRAISQAQATLDRIDSTVGLSAPLEEARGQLALHQHLWTKAASHLEKARAQLEGLFGALAPELSPVLDALAQVQEATGRTAEEIATRRRSLAILEASHGPEDRALVDALEPLVKAELRSRRWTEALADARRSLALREQARGDAAPDPALPLATYRVGLALARLGRTDEAREVLEQARTRAGADGADRRLIEMSLASLADPPEP